MTDTIRPFRIAVPDEVLQRPARPPAPHPLARGASCVDDWSQGVPLAWMQDVCALLGRRATTGARARPRSTASTSSSPRSTALDIHFIHVRSPHPQARAAAAHPRLARLDRGVPQGDRAAADPARFGGNAADAFHVVCPSLPGYGFSGKPATTGWGVDRIAAGLGRADGAARLRPLRRAGRRLGLGGHRFARRAGPAALRRHPRHAGHRRRAPTCRASRPTRRSARCAVSAHYRRWDSGYSKQQAHPSADAGLRADRLAGGTGRMDPREVLGLDRLRRPPRERARPRRAARQRDALLGERHGRVVGAAVLGELRQGRRAPAGGRADRRGRVPEGDRDAGAQVDGAALHATSFTGREMPKGGHFAAFEQPELFVEEVRGFFRTLR